MCFQEPLIRIAIYGASATGKSSVASALEVLLKNKEIKIRHCGQVLKESAKKLGLSFPEGLTKDLHEVTDFRTREFALNNPNILIEGRYLQYVLSDSKNIMFVKLVANVAVRSSRVAHRDAVPFEQGQDTIIKADHEDQSLIQDLYGNIICNSKSHLILDTSTLTIIEAADLILNDYKNHDTTQ